MPTRVAPPPGARNLVVVTLDSLRHDAWIEAPPQSLAFLGPAQLRYSWASWTAPSHYNFLTGLMPHSNPPGIFAPAYIEREYRGYEERLGVRDLGVQRMLPGIFLPSLLVHGLGYTTHARVSLPALHPDTVLNRDFDSYELMPRHNDLAAMLETLPSADERPFFLLINAGETHYPYALPTEDPADWPRISGVHGVLKHIGEQPTADPLPDSGAPFFDPFEMNQLRGRQIDALVYLDAVIGRLLDRLPENTWLIVTSDHGELFGEGGMFGHGPTFHPKVHEVPFVEGFLGDR